MVSKPICMLLPAALLFVSSAEAEIYTPVPADPDNAANIYLTAGADYMNASESEILRSRDYLPAFQITETLPQFRAHASAFFVDSADLMPQRG